VAVELGVEIERMIRRPQRKTEIVHREHIFESLLLICVWKECVVIHIGNARRPSAENHRDHALPDSCACRDHDHRATR
jgi:hypothetical protein